jgi:hypothetical protein
VLFVCAPGQPSSCNPLRRGCVGRQVGTTSPGLITVFIIIITNLLEGKADERRHAHEAARFLVGYKLGK